MNLQKTKFSEQFKIAHFITKDFLIYTRHVVPNFTLRWTGHVVPTRQAIHVYTLLSETPLRQQR
jgi:hypothetical protein